MPFWGFGTKTPKQTQKKKSKPSVKKRAEKRKDLQVEQPKPVKVKE